jgi:hypothetical protein
MKHYAQRLHEAGEIQRVRCSPSSLTETDHDYYQDFACPKPTKGNTLRQSPKTAQSTSLSPPHSQSQPTYLPPPSPPQTHTNTPTPSSP